MRSGVWVWGSLCVVVLLALSSAARADSASDARDAFRRGVEASQQGKWEAAREAFETSRQAVEKPSTLFNLAVACVKLGRGEEALGALEAFERTATQDQHASMLRSVPGLREQARSLVRPTVSRDDAQASAPVDTRGFSAAVQSDVALGTRAFSEGRDQEALEAFERAYRQSRSAELLFDIGLAADRLRRDERAVRAFESFVAALPEHANAPYARTRTELLRNLISERQRMRVAPVIDVESKSERTPALRTPRALIGVGAALLASSIGAGLWWNHQSDQLDDCRSAPCDNEPALETRLRAAIGATLALDVVGVGLVSAGSVWLVRNKRVKRALAGFDVRVGPFGTQARYRF